MGPPRSLFLVRRKRNTGMSAIRGGNIRRDRNRPGISGVSATARIVVRSENPRPRKRRHFPDQREDGCHRLELQRSDSPWFAAFRMLCRNRDRRFGAFRTGRHCPGPRTEAPRFPPGSCRPSRPERIYCKPRLRSMSDEGWRSRGEMRNSVVGPVSRVAAGWARILLQEYPEMACPQAEENGSMEFPVGAPRRLPLETP